MEHASQAEGEPACVAQYIEVVLDPDSRYIEHTIRGMYDVDDSSGFREHSHNIGHKASAL